MNNVCGNIIGLISAHYKPVTYILNHLGLFLNLLYFLRQGYVCFETIFNVLPYLFGLLALEQGEGGRWRIHYDLGNDRKISAISFLSPSQPRKLSLFFIKKFPEENFFRRQHSFSFSLSPSRLPINWSQCELWGKIKRRRTSNVGKKKTEVIAIVKERSFFTQPHIRTSWHMK